MRYCKRCDYPFKTLWNCQYGHHRDWVSICYNCIRELRFTGVRFIGEIENIKRKIAFPTLKPKPLYLPLYKCS